MKFIGITLPIILPDDSFAVAESTSLLPFPFLMLEIRVALFLLIGPAKDLSCTFEIHASLRSSLTFLLIPTQKLVSNW